MTQQWCAIGLAIFEIQLVGEFVDDDVVAAAGRLYPLARLVPRQYHRPFVPRLARPDLLAFLHHTGAHMPGRRDNVGAGINEDGPEAGIIVGIAMKQQKAGEGSHADFDLIRDDQTITALKPFFGQKNLDVPFKFPAIRFRQLTMEA